MSSVLPDWYESKPLAGVADLGTGGRWVPHELTEDELELYRQVVDTSGRARVPPGVIPMIARLGYLAGHRAPPGGVLSRLRWWNHGPPPADGRFLVRSFVAEDQERNGRRRVVVVVDVADRSEAPVARVAWHLIWPEGAP